MSDTQQTTEKKEPTIWYTMKKDLNFIIIGAAMGIVPTLIHSFWYETFQRYAPFVIVSLLVGGVTGGICGGIGGAISNKNWGAVLGGLVGTFMGVLFTNTLAI